MAKNKKNRQSSIVNRQSTGFTIVELLVAMSLLIILLGLSSMVFKTTVAAHRAAGAAIDVSRNLRAITDQLTTDFRGLQKDAPLTIWFEYDPVTRQRYDQIQFFADGDFQTTKQYGTPLQTVYGNMARIYYGHAWTVDLALKAGQTSEVANNYIDAGVLARRVQFFTSDIGIPLVNNDLANNSPFPDINQINNVLTTFSQSDNNFFEYDQLATIQLWKTVLTDVANCNLYLASCFNNTQPVFAGFLPDYVASGHPAIDFGDIRHLHNLLAQGVIQMRIQWAYTNNDLIDLATGLSPAGGFAGVRWWPSVDPLGDGNDSVAGTDVDSDFNTMGNQFGAYFKMPDGSGIPDWLNVISAVSTERCRTDDGSGTNTDVYFRQDFYPKALKFSFVMTDSNGVFSEGKSFTHIVYLDN